MFKQQLCSAESNMFLKTRKLQEKIGENINWQLSFAWVKEKERTKHVHRLHPYKGKFIPQLVEYFLDQHVDEFKKEIFFREGDIIIDPFAGSGTTLIQANELGIHGIGIDVSEFNALIAEVKFANVSLMELQKHVQKILTDLLSFEEVQKIREFEVMLDKEIKKFNTLHFAVSGFKKLLDEGKVPKDYIEEKEREISNVFFAIAYKYGIKLLQEQTSSDTFIDTWYVSSIKTEAQNVLSYISQIDNEAIQKTLKVILSRAMRSVRSTTHMDLDRLKTPQATPYFCYKHFKICVPPFSLATYFEKYAYDTIKRLEEYQQIKTSAFQCMLTGDSRNIDLDKELKNKYPQFHEIFRRKKAKGIFTSPPYLGQLDYHEQHAYSYELFGIQRKDIFEIGSAMKGSSMNARKEYIEDISNVLTNMNKYLTDDAHIFIVANDKYNLYYEIANRAGLRIVEEMKRPVLNRTSRDRHPYSESIFHMVKKG